MNYLNLTKSAAAAGVSRSWKLTAIAVWLGVLMAPGGTSFGQCDKDKTVILTSSKTDYLDGSGALQRTMDEKSLIEISQTRFARSEPGSDQNKMEGKVKSISCNWKVPFKEGKTVIQATMAREGSGETKDATITIEGKDGKVTLVMEIQQMPDRKIRVGLRSLRKKSSAYQAEARGL